MEKGKKALIIMVFLLLGANRALAAWFDADFNYKRRLVIQNSQVDGDLADFPVLITQANLDSNFFSHVLKTTVSNMDIIFTNAAENAELDREVVVFSSGSSLLEVWVKVPALADSTDTEIYMYYGNAGANKPNSTSTWSNGFAGVWHLNEATGDFIDSSPNGNTGTTPGGSNDLPTQITGAIQSAQDFDGNGDLVDFGEPASLDIWGNNSLTVQAWVWFDALSGSTYYDYLTKGDHQYLMQKRGNQSDNRVQFAIYDTDWRSAYSNNNMNINTWYSTVGRYDRTNGNEVSLFVNGFKQTSVETASTIAASNNNVMLGRNDEYSNQRYLNGRMDEARICNVPRSDAWISTEYKNQSAPASFYLVDAEQSKETPTYTPTITKTPTISPTPTCTPTLTITNIFTRTITPTPPPSSTFTPTGTITPTSTISPTMSITATRSITPTRTITATRTITMTQTISPTPTISQTMTMTSTPNVAAADLSGVVLYPNPYRGDFNRRNQIVFFNLPNRVLIRVYSLDGKLVREINKDDLGNRAVWDLCNNRGKSVASGIYLYILKTDREQKTGKILLSK